MKRITSSIFVLAALLVGCTAEETVLEPADFKFDGTCVNCHAGLTAGHVHANYKLRCIDCHGGDDQVAVPDKAFENKSLAPGGKGFRDPDLVAAAHVLPGSDNGKPGTQKDPTLARFFYANGVDDDLDGFIDETIDPTEFVAGGTLSDLGEVFEPGMHGDGGGEFMDMELNRDLNYTRFLNPGDLRVATIGCGRGNRAAFDGGGGGLCHQETIDIVRRSIMVNQAAVTNGAYYGNESWDASFVAQRDKNGEARDPRFGAFSYALDYDGDPDCVKPPPDLKNPRSQPFFDRACLQARATAEDSQVGANATGCGPAGDDPCGNTGLPAFEIAQGTSKGDLIGGKQTVDTKGAGDSRWEGWGGQAVTGDPHAELAPLLDRDIPGLEGVVPDPVDNILRTFRAYYPLNYMASTNNFNFTFGTSILPDIKNVKTSNPYGRGHSSGCAACHTPYNYEGNRRSQKLRQDDGTFISVDDPTTKHREFDPANDEGPRDDSAAGDGSLIHNRLLGRPVGSDDVFRAGGVARGAVDFNNDGVKDGEQQKTYSDNHVTTTKIDTDTCGLCHGFVTRINYAYQGAAEEEQRDVLARRGAIRFTTPKGTKVAILDSWVREDVSDPANPKIIKPEGLPVIAAAKERDAKLAQKGCEDGKVFPACGMIAGAGGCAQNQFSEDCNNNGELDTNLVLERKDADGNVLFTETINEDANGNGTLDLIDRVPREKSIDGRQIRYVYGGRNGSTRQMDVHFERGMHCIDCHFMQDVHGDGNVYSTNWDAIEIECEDCHGANKKTNFLTSGPNGGNDMRIPVNENLEPYFEERNGQVIQRSRVNTGLEWVVPQTIDASSASPYAREAHDPEYHLAEPGTGSEFAGEQGSTELLRAKVECATCHNGFLTNCLNCHVDIDVGDKQRKLVNGTTGDVTASAGENEIWLRNRHNKGHINFQLLGLLRSTFSMGVSSLSEKGRLGLFRSSMQVAASVTDGNGDSLRDQLPFTTFQTKEGNSGRMNAATSGMAMNQTMAHTVRPDEARGCEMCHSLVNDQGQSRNEHLMAYAFGVGTGSIPVLGDYAVAAGQNGLELFEYKQERELINHLVPGQSNRFPGLIINPTGNGGAGSDRHLANVEPTGIAAAANDVVLIKNFNATPPLGGIQAPSLRDFAVMALSNGQVVITDVSARAHPSAARPALGNANLVQVLTLPGGAVGRALARLPNDVSDPFIYVAAGANGVCVVEMLDAALLAGPFNAANRGCTAVQGTANEIYIDGDLLFVGTTEGTIQTFDISTTNAAQIQPRGSVNVGASVNEIQIAGFSMFVATQQGLTILDLSDPANPVRPTGAPNFVAGTSPALSVAVGEGHAFVVTNNNVFDVDAKTIAAPKAPVSIVPAGQTVTPADVILSQMPGQRWVLVLEQTGALVGIKLDNTKSKLERCFPNPQAQDCLLEVEMYDATRSSRDPSFNPATGTFDAANVDPSAPPFFRMAALLNTTGRRMIRPVLFEQLGFLSGRRYRDSFMPGSGVISFPVMKAMHDVQVCEVSSDNSTNPSGIGELGYFDGGGCQPFGGAAKPKRKACKAGAWLGPNLRRAVCPDEAVKTAAPVEQRPAPLPPMASPIDLAPTTRSTQTSMR
jgi:hypothetical protein